MLTMEQFEHYIFERLFIQPEVNTSNSEQSPSCFSDRKHPAFWLSAILEQN